MLCGPQDSRRYGHSQLFACLWRVADCPVPAERFQPGLGDGLCLVQGDNSIAYARLMLISAHAGTPCRPGEPIYGWLLSRNRIGRRRAGPGQGGNSWSVDCAYPSDLQALLYYTFAAIQGHRPAAMAMGYRHWAGISVQEVHHKSFNQPI